MIRRFSHAGTARLLWAPLALLMAWPVGAVEQIPASTNVSGRALLTQAQPDIPAEVQSWFDGAKAAAAKGDAAEALRLQKQVLTWLEGHPGAPVVFRARALINLGIFLSGVGQRQEALPPTEAAVRLLRPLAGSQPEAKRFLAIALTNLGVRYSKLGRRQEALAPTEEAVKIYRELAKTNPAFQGDLARSLTNLGYFQLQLGQPEIARSAYEESIAIARPLAASNPAFQEDLQRTLNSLEQLNRDEGIRSGATQVLGAADVRYLPSNDSTTPVKRAVVRLWPTFSVKNAGIGLLGTGFVVRRQGDRAWIATALHVVREPDGNSVATKLEAELFTGPLPPGLVPPRLEVVLNPSQPLPESGDEPILLEVRGLPPDVQPLPLANTPAQGVLMIVGHPSQPGPWTMVRYPLLTSNEEALLLAGGLASGASGAPVLRASQQVVGVVYDSPEVSKSRPIAQTWAFPVKALAEKMK